MKKQIDYTKIDNIEFDGIEPKDRPDYANAYIVSADYDGVQMTDEQIEALDSGFVHESLIDHLS